MCRTANNYEKRYWLVNGRGFPDTVADNFASWLPSQPYGALARIHEFNTSLPANDPNYHPYPGIVRYVNVGTQEFPFHPHGNNGLVIGNDGQPVVGAAGEHGLREVRDLVAGQTWDVLFRWNDAENYDEATNPSTSDHPRAPASQSIGMYYSGSPCLGHKAPCRPACPHQPVRRVLHHLAQPRAVPVDILGRRHDRPHHLRAHRPTAAEFVPVIRRRTCKIKDTYPV
ncbi:MAG: hypothetical protein R2856_27035 [Caldilineaceae bacterium]